MEEAFERHGSPKHLIADQGEVFASEAFGELRSRREVKQCFGAVGQQGSIAVTERAIRTLKGEWLRRVPTSAAWSICASCCRTSRSTTTTTAAIVG